MSTWWWRNIVRWGVCIRWRFIITSKCNSINNNMIVVECEQNNVTRSRGNHLSSLQLDWLSQWTKFVEWLSEWCDVWVVHCSSIFTWMYQSGQVKYLNMKETVVKWISKQKLIKVRKKVERESERNQVKWWKKSEAKYFTNTYDCTSSLTCLFTDSLTLNYFLSSFFHWFMHKCTITITSTKYHEYANDFGRYHW